MPLLWSPFGSRGSLASLSHFAFLHWWSMLPSCPMSVESAHQCVHSDGQDFLRLEALDVSGGGKSARVWFQERGVKVTSSVQRETCKWRKRSGSTNASCEDSIASTWIEDLGWCPGRITRHAGKEYSSQTNTGHGTYPAWGREFCLAPTPPGRGAELAVSGFHFLPHGNAPEDPLPLTNN